MATLCSFAPLCRADARVLILGSMPGRASLEAGRYYAHPRNSFWPIMGEALGFDPAIDYAARCSALGEGGIALWDVLARCRRGSSLDSDIVADSLVANDLGGLLERHPAIRRILFNGAMAERCFCRLVLPQLSPRCREISRRRLPSTSPAHAGMRYAAKRAVWLEALR